MDATVRATCPKCGTGLRIPAQWVGQAVKCKKCGSVVRTKAKSTGATAASDGTAESAPFDGTMPHAPQQPVPPQGNAFEFSKAAPNDGPLPQPTPAGEPAPNVGGFDLFGGSGGEVPPAPAMPGYPYPLPPGYPPPAGYAPPAGYPYAVPPGYPHPAPGGYPYPYPQAYGPPGSYGQPHGYPYGAPAGAMPADFGQQAGVPQPASHTHNPLANAPAKPAAAFAHQPPRAYPPADSFTHGNEFQADDTPSPAANRYRKSGGGGKAVWIIVCLLMTAGLVAAGIFGSKYLKEKADKALPTDPAKLVERLGSSDNDEREAVVKAIHELGPKAEAALRVGCKSDNPDIAKKSNELLAELNGSPSGGSSHSAVKGGPFPRRLLFMHLSKYMFLNPLTASAPGAPDRTKGAALRLAFEWHVPSEKDNNQLFFLSDSAPPERGLEVQTPMKNVVMGTYERFFETSRAQDRIVVYFGGHAVEVGGKPYIAPVEGDLDDPESLIPLENFYSRLQACKATQKVVIWDVCRFNPERGRQRPGADPMSESLFKSLSAAPPGVEVVIACQAGENALEFYNLQLESAANAPHYSGSLFLESAKYVAEKNRNVGKAPSPSDPIAIADWAPAVGARVNAMAAASSPEEKRMQTLHLEGKLPATLVAFNPEEPAAKRFDIPQAPKGTSVAAIREIELEFAVPPLKVDVTDSGLADLPFKEEIMKDYKSDVSVKEIEADKEKYKFQWVTLNAFRTIAEIWASGGEKGGPQIHDVVPAPVTDATKKQIFKELDFWAVGIAKLTLVDGDLDALASMKESQAKRWQAHYEYARAIVKSRLAYMNEYNKLMGDVRTETLPPLDKMLGQNQYRLVSSEKMKSKNDVKKLADDAQEAYATLITHFKGTPWAIQAKRQKTLSLGLFWRPSTDGAPTPE